MASEDTLLLYAWIDLILLMLLSTRVNLLKMVPKTMLVQFCQHSTCILAWHIYFSVAHTLVWQFRSGANKSSSFVS